MQALDTNVLVRFLVQDDDTQVAIVTQRFAIAEAERQPLYVSLLVVLEIIWVLESAYRVERNDLLTALTELLSMPALQFESPPVLRAFIQSARNNTFDLSDLLIGQAGHHADCETTLTFDKKAAKSPLFEHL